MKKSKIISCIFASLLVCTGIATATSSIAKMVSNEDIVAVAEDLLSNNVSKVSVKKAASTSKVEHSKIYTQVASDDVGNYYLRFATAIKGDFEKVVYSADIEGSDYQIQDKSVTSVYKAITANGEKSYFTGNSLIDEELQTTKEFYWACFTIKYGNESIE